MELSRLKRSHKFAGAAGVVLIAVLFLKWYETNGIGSSGWESLTYVDIIVFIAGLAGVAYALLQALGADAVPPSVVTGLAALATVLAFYRMAAPPGEASLALGPVIAILAGVAEMNGGWLGMREEGEGFANDPEMSPETGPPRSQSEI